ncbi:MAG: CvpA family protein [Dysgonomonas sp.]
MWWFDFIVVLVLAFAIIKGYLTGFILQIAYLAGLLLAAIFAGQLAERIMPHLQFESLSIHVTKPITYILAFALITTAIVAIGKLLTETLKAIKLNLPNRLAGSLFSIIKYLLIISLLINVFSLFKEEKTESHSDSITYPYIKKIVPAIIPYFRLINDDL